MNRYAGGFIYNPETGRVLLQQRSMDAPHSQGLWIIFGGGEEPEDNGDIAATFIREIREETGIELTKEDLNPLDNYWVSVEKDRVERNVFWVSRVMDESAINLTEGMAYGWFTFKEARSLNTGPKTFQDLELLEKTINE